MLTVLAFHAGDRDQAERLAGWIAQLGGCKGHELLLLRDQSAAPIDFSAGFDRVEEIVVTDDRWHSWPESPNNVFRKAAKHIQYLKPQPWLWLEPDVVPMRSGWLDALWDEWRRGKKHFMGDFVTGIGGSEDHMSGIAIYPGEMTAHAGNAVIAMEIPFDLAGASQIRPKAHFTELIQHVWKRPPFTSIEEVRAEIKPEVVLFHSDKSGSAIRLLRAEMFPETKEGGDAPSDTTKHTNSIVTANSVEKNESPASSAAPKSDPESAAIDALPAFGSKAYIEKYHKHPPGEPGFQWIEVKKPWESPHDSIEEIKRLCARLAEFCTSPAQKHHVRVELAFAKVIMGKKTAKRAKLFRRKKRPNGGDEPPHE